MYLTEGDNAPDFTLKDQHDEDFTLSEQMGRRVLLSFHPLAFTPVCTRQMQSIEDAFYRFESSNTTPVGISVDAWPAKHAWAREMGIRNLRILSDFWPHGGLAGKLGLLRGREGFSERANLLLDEQGRLIWSKVYEIPELPDLDEVLGFLGQI
jgi:peroxiredoxin